MKITRHWHDIQFVAEMTKESDWAWVELKAYEIVGWIEGHEDKPLYPKIGATASGDDDENCW